jgi:hypothetical protein
VSVGVPVGLCIYWGWVRRPSAGTTKATGFVGALAAALLGAWLGFHAAADLLALLTAIAGAVAGGNLILLALDVAWDRQVRDRFAATHAKETLEARPSTG